MKVIPSRWTPFNCRARSINKPWHQYVGMGECSGMSPDLLEHGAGARLLRWF
jgi:hypothetical protein